VTGIVDDAKFGWEASCNLDDRGRGRSIGGIGQLELPPTITQVDPYMPLSVGDIISIRGGLNITKYETVRHEFVQCKIYKLKY
jgi:hypothetical protein